MKLGILSLMNGSHWGGSEELWFHLANWAALQGHEVMVVCYDWDAKKEKLDQLRKRNIRIHLLPHKRSFFRRYQLKKIVNRIPWQDQDLVLVNQGGYKEVIYPPFDSLHKKLKNYVLGFHNYDESETLSHSGKERLAYWMKGAAINAGDAARIFEVIEKNIGIRVSNKEVWPNPVTIEPPASPTAYPSHTDGNYHWTVLAELDVNRKAQDLLIKTLATDKWRNRNWVLHLYGRGKDEPMLRNLIAGYQLENKIILEGFRTDIKEILQQTHVLFQCTRIDAMPLSVVEAMAMARPCFVSNVGDMPAWVDQKKGWVCTELTPEGLDASLEKCWEQRKGWEQMGQYAFQTFLEKYPIPYEEHIFERIRSIL